MNVNKFGVRIEKEEKLSKRMGELGIREDDSEETFIHSSGPGGQSVNKASTCVQIKHIPTGIVVRSQREHSQGLNRFLARRLLASKSRRRYWAKGLLSSSKGRRGASKRNGATGGRKRNSPQFLPRNKSECLTLTNSCITVADKLDLFAIIIRDIRLL